MIPAHWQTLQPYIDKALESDDAGRAALLRELRANDPALAEQLAQLLAAHQAAAVDGFLSQPLTPQVLPGEPQVGQRLGAYTLLQTLGEGGSGAVWLAQRDDGRFEGQVAIKLLHQRLADARHAERFRREGQLLARLTHPHVARLLDAGIGPTGQPYLVLEHVQGQPIDNYCDAQGLDVPARIRLFLALLDAVAHAHRHLVVHRDIKPGNVMVTADGQVKLLDFGVAKLLGEGDAPDLQLTQQIGAGLTPGYAAPEQWQNGNISTATDVYALGVLLFVLLAGRHPTLKAGDSVADAVRNTVEQDAPRLQLTGDLDNIVAKALQREAGLRYPTASAMADDLQRHLDHRPIAARAPTWRYIAHKFLRRHRLPLVLVAAGLSVSLGLGLVAWQNQQARQLTEARAQTVDGLLQSLFNGMSPDAATSRQFTAQELLARAQAYLDGAGGLDPATRRAARLRVAGLYRDVGAYREAETSYQAELADAVRADDAHAHAEALWHLANLQVKRQDPTQASQTLAQLQSLLSTPRLVADNALRARHALLQGEVALGANQLSEAAAQFDRAANWLAATTPPDLELQARAAHGRGSAARRQGDMAGARRFLAQALDLNRRRGPDAVVDGLRVALDVGRLESWTGQFGSALAVLAPARQALHARLGPQHALSLAASSEQAYALIRTGRFADARRLLAEMSRDAGPTSTWVPEHVQLLEARILMYEGRLDQAEPALAQRLLAKEKAEGRINSATEPLRRLHAEALLRQGQGQQALAELRSTIDHQTALAHADHNSVAITEVLLGCALARQGDLAAARQSWQHASGVLQRDLGAQHPFALVAASYLALSDPAPATAEAGRALADRVERELGWQHGAKALARWLREPAARADWRQWPVVM